MAASGKKSKKHKGKTIPLTDFLADGTSGPGPGKVIVRNRTWADEVENEDDGYYSSSRSKQAVVLPTAPREARSARSVDEENLPRSAPFKAYIVNLHYDTSERDVLALFEGMRVVDVQLPRDERGGGRLKGFGYIEFETREDLIAALAMDDASIKGRRMRIEVSVNNDAGNNNERRGGGRYESREYDPERTQGDWRSGPRTEMPTAKPAFGRSIGGVPSDRGAFTHYNMDGPPAKDGESFAREDVADQDALARERCSFSRESMDQRPRDHRDFRAVSGNDGRFGHRGRYRDNNNTYRGKNYGNAHEERGRHFGNQGAGYHSDDRTHPQNYNNDRRNPSEPEALAEVKTRPKLCLAQRTVAPTEDCGTAAVSVQSAIFGGARPVDTAAREKEIENNRMRQRESHGVRRWENDDVDDGDRTVATNIEGKPFESGDQTKGVADECLSLDPQENVKTKENDESHCETPDIEPEADEDSLAKSVRMGHVPGIEVEATGKQHLTQDSAARPSIFGEAKPVDTSTRDREVEERIAKSTEKIRDKLGREVEALVLQHLQKPPARSTIFGGATPVDTAAREREVEGRLARERKAGPPARQSSVYTGGAARPPPPHVQARLRAVGGNLDEQQVKKEENEQLQVAKKYEVAQPPVENVWLRRAAQQAANQERGQVFAPPMAFKNTHGL